MTSQSSSEAEEKESSQPDPDEIDKFLAELLQKRELTASTTETIKIRAVLDFDPRQMSAGDKTKFAISVERWERKEYDFEDFDELVQYSEDTACLKESCLSIQPTQDKHINFEEEFRSSRIKVYSRRDEKSDIEDVDKARKMEEWKRIMRERELVTYRKYLQNRNYSDDLSAAEETYPHVADSPLELIPLHGKDFSLGEDTVDTKIEDVAVKMEELKKCMRWENSITEKVGLITQHKNGESENIHVDKFHFSSLTNQDVKINREKEFRPFKVKVYSRREEVIDCIDNVEQEEAIQMKEWISVMHQNNWTIEDRQLNSVSEWESNSISEKEFDRMSEGQFHRIPESESDVESDRESVRELVSCHSDESDDSVAEMKKIASVMALTIKSGDKMETVASENIGDAKVWWLVRKLDSGEIGFIPRNRVVTESDHQISNTELNDLPLEMLDQILENSFVHWTLKLSPLQRDVNVLKTLASVDYCWFQRTIRPRFKKRIWHRLKEFYATTQKRPAIIRTNQNYLLEKIEPNDNLIAAMMSFNCITKEQCHLFHRRRSKRSRNAELLHLLRSFDETKFSNVVKCLRQTNQKTAARILENGGGVINVELLQFDANCSESMNSNYLHTKLEDLQSRKKLRSQQTVKHLSQLKDNNLEILDSKLGRHTVVVWIWCRSQKAIENIQRLYKSNQLREIFFGLTNYKSLTTEIMQSTVINIDQNNFKRAVVKCPIYINFAERISVGKNEILGLTKLRNKIYVICKKSYSDTLIRVFQDQNLFRLEKTLKFEETKSVEYFESNVKESCIYVGDSIDNCIWKITREANDQYKLIKWLAIDDFDSLILSVSNNGNFLVVSDGPPILRIYGSKAELLRSIQLPKDIDQPIHAVETSVGNFIILHKWMEVEVAEDSDASEEEDEKWVISEVISDGQKVVRQFNPSNEKLKLCGPECLAIDSDDRVFVADRGNRRVILLDSDLEWDRILFSTKQELDEDGNDGDRDEERRRCSLCYDEEKKQLIVRAFLASGEGFIVYNLSHK